MSNSFHITVRFHVETTMEVTYSDYKDGVISSRADAFNRKDARRALRALVDGEYLSAEPLLIKQEVEEAGGGSILPEWMDAKIVDHQPIETHISQ